MKTVHFRFYEELNDFLPIEKRKVRFAHEFIDRVSVKDVIESLGIPHTEIDLILVNSVSVDFNYIIEEGDDISVYPVFDSMDIRDVQHLREVPLRQLKFVLDVHLGKLAKWMRMLGFDSRYENNYSDEQIAELSIAEKRTILTMDRGILKRKNITRGYWVRNSDPFKQVIEIIDRFDLKKELNELTRCLSCNNLLEEIEKDKVLNRLPEKVKLFNNEFFICTRCDKIFWKGSHYKRMQKLIEKIKNS